MSPEDEPIGKGATTLDYLRAKHPWLGYMIDALKADVEAAKHEGRANVTRVGILAYQIVLAGHAYVDDGMSDEWWRAQLKLFRERLDELIADKGVA